MADILLGWDELNAQGDWSISGGDLVSSNSVEYGDLQSAVLVSLFTDLGSWWGDSYETTPTGSNLYTLFRSSISNRQQLLLQAKDYCTAALQWLITDGVAASVVVKTAFTAPTALGINITITKPQQSATVTYNYSWVWK